jgi:hypothetical protein
VEASFTLLMLQIGLLALATGVLGLLCGRYLWPRQVIVTPPARVPEPLTDDLEPALSDLEERLQASESQVAQLRRAVTQVTDDASGDSTTG